MTKDNSNILALIPARAGSKGLPGKNVMAFCGKPLIAWSIEAALQSVYDLDVVVSTDGDDIAEIAREYGAAVPFMRPATLAGDEASSLDVMTHALDYLETAYDYLVLLQPTSPLRLAEDIDAAFRLMQQRNAPACVSVSALDKNPEWFFDVEPETYLLKSRGHGFSSLPHRRQETKNIYALNGAVYIARTDYLRERGSFMTSETSAYIMPGERSVDIDTRVQFEYAQFLMQQREAQ